MKKRKTLSLPGFSEKSALSGAKLNSLSDTKLFAERKAIESLSVISVGEARGHGEWIDKEFVSAVADQINQAGDVGIRAHFGHPGMCSDAIGTEMGRFKNARMVLNEAASEIMGYEFYQALADWDATPVTESNRQYIDHVFHYAEKSPSEIGISIVHSYTGFRGPEDGTGTEYADEKITEEGYFVDNPLGFPHPILGTLYDADFVSTPAANATGLKSDNPLQFAGDLLYRFLSADPEILERVESVITMIKGDGPTEEQRLKAKIQALETQNRELRRRNKLLLKHTK